MGAQAHEALTVAAAQLAGTVVRTSASVIGRRGNDSVIVATTSWGYTVTALVTGLRTIFHVRPRGWLRRSYAVEGIPAELVAQIIDPAQIERIAALAPLSIELGTTALRLEQKYGDAAAMEMAIDLVATLVSRTRQAEGLIPQ